MPTWGQILAELKDGRVNGKIQYDIVRRKYLKALQEKTGRNTIVYATKFTQADETISPNALVINDEDLHGFMEVIHGLTGSSLDLILHSPGGSIDAADALVNYLRSKFTDIRVIVPQQAMSAAAMIACASNCIVMGKHSFLGPTDPQFVMNTPLGQRMVPAQAILDQFEKALKACQTQSNLAAYLPMLGQFGPDLLVKAESANKYSRELVKDWLENFMFAGEADAAAKAVQISKWLSDHKDHGRHSRHIPRTMAEEKGLKVVHLENDQEIQDLVLSVFHATMLTLTGSMTVKVIENHLGKAFVKMGGQMVMSGPAGMMPGAFPAFLGGAEPA